MRQKPFDFLYLARALTPLSIILSLAALAVVAQLGFSYGIDFAGGNEIHARLFSPKAEAASLRQLLSADGLSGASVQSISSEALEGVSPAPPPAAPEPSIAAPGEALEGRGGAAAQAAEDGKDSASAAVPAGGPPPSDKGAAASKEALPQGPAKEFLIRLKSAESEEENTLRLSRLKESLKKGFPDVQILRVDSVGPQIGKEMRRKGLLAIFYSLLMILVYLGLRFDLRYSAGAVFCLFHDAILTLSLFSLFQFEVTSQTLAAILAIIGYSLNDTIVTFDRIRENKALLSEKKALYEICNISLSNVLSRTLITSATTLLATVSMWIFADGVIKDFAFTLTIGVAIGTYSSLFVAAPLLFAFSSFSGFKGKKGALKGRSMAPGPLKRERD